VAELEYDVKIASELAKYPKVAPNPQVPQNGDIENDARYAQNFVTFIGNSGRQAKIIMTSDFAPEVAV